MPDDQPTERIFRASSIVVAVDPDPYAYTVTLRMLTTGGTPTLQPGDRPNLEWNPTWRDAAARSDGRSERAWLESQRGTVQGFLDECADDDAPFGTRRLMWQNRLDQITEDIAELDAARGEGETK